MKKFVLKVATCLALASCGLVTTSCGDETVNQIIEMLITNLLGQQGTVYQYSVAGQAQKLYKETADGGYLNGAEARRFTGLMPVTVNGSSAKIVIPAMTVDGIEAGQITFDGLDLAAGPGEAYTVMTVGDNTRVDGSAVINGKTYGVANVFIKDAHLTSEQMSMAMFQVFFGDNGEYVLSLTNVGGKVVAQ